MLRVCVLVCVPVCVIGASRWQAGVEDQVSMGVVRQLLPDKEALVVNPAWEIWPSADMASSLITYNGWVWDAKLYY